MEIERREKDNDKLVVKCSATESVNASFVVKNGFIALRYRKVGIDTNPEEAIPIPDTIIEIRNNIQFRILVESVLNFLIISETVAKIVGRSIITPA